MSKKNWVKILPAVLVVMMFSACASLSEFLFGPSETGTTGSAAAPASASAATVFLANGTYTFYPRLQAAQGGVDKTAYLDKIEAKNGQVTIFISNVPRAKGNVYGTITGDWGGDSVILQDLDNPVLSYNPAKTGWTDDYASRYLNFEGVRKATRFSLTTTDNPAVTFEEIVLGEPDQDLGMPALADGTYTYYPRLRGFQAGKDVTAYLDKIEVKGGQVTLFVSNVPRAKGNVYGTITGDWGGDSVILQDLDNPVLSYNPAKTGWTDDYASRYLTFDNIKSRRFSVETPDNPPVLFEEVVLGEPDKDLGITPLANGTYTFFPRLQAMQGGRDVTAYLDKIVVRGGYLTVYISNVAVGNGSVYGTISGSWTSGSLILQDLDYPVLSYNPTQTGNTEDGTSRFQTFEKINPRRFSLETPDGTPVIFDEIILGQPD